MKKEIHPEYKEVVFLDTSSVLLLSLILCGACEEEPLPIPELEEMEVPIYPDTDPDDPKGNDEDGLSWLHYS